MEKELNLAFLGPILIKIDGKPLDSLVSTKAQAVLAYLLFQQRPLPRQTVASLFWGEMLEEDARRNLRGVIMKLRQALAPYLLIENQTLGFNFESPHSVDVFQFVEMSQADSIAELEKAVSLYRGEFLAGFVVRDTPEFESWIERERAKFHQAILQVHDKLLAQYEESGLFGKGIALAKKLIELEPTREASHRHLIRLLAKNGQVDTAVDHFELLTTLLQNELEVDVSSESRQLLQEIRDGNFFTSDKVFPRHEAKFVTHPSHKIEAPPPFIAGPPITYPARFFGREAIVKRVFRLFQKRPFQNAALIGPRRSGKTSLLHYLKNVTIAPNNQRRADQRHDWLNEPHLYRWVFVDFQDARFGEMSRLLSYILGEMGLTMPSVCELEQFLDIVADELRYPTIILFDEIGVALNRYGDTLDDAFWESLRSLATNQVDGHLGFVLSSHQQPGDLAQSQGFGSPFFNIFGYTAVLRALQEDEARQLIASSPIPFPSHDVEWILKQSELWPMPLQILCRERLLTLEEQEQGDAWRDEALRQLAPFQPGNKSNKDRE